MELPVSEISLPKQIREWRWSRKVKTLGLRPLTVGPTAPFFSEDFSITFPSTKAVAVGGQVLSALALVALAVAEPESQALLGDDQCEGAQASYGVQKGFEEASCWVLGWPRLLEGQWFGMGANQEQNRLWEV